MSKNKKKQKSKKELKAYCTGCRKYITKFYINTKDICNNWDLFNYDLSDLCSDPLVILKNGIIKFEIESNKKTQHLNFDFINKELSEFANHPLSSKFFPIFNTEENEEIDGLCDVCQELVIIKSTTKDVWDRIRDEWEDIAYVN